MSDAEADAAEAAPVEPAAAHEDKDNSSLNTAASREDLGPEAKASIDYTRNVIRQLRISRIPVKFREICGEKCLICWKIRKIFAKFGQVKEIL